ncbi:uncharacterized protein PV09_03082 [Verruconis gallopava]|uniref:Zn(2)-C6 fungal-type domain-containing protein n=1 Tax=Verruconis gallopava TaxID=253628 RepID=A0A0D1YYX0_9PEZI|nr:uncharacterized protein PV09_03082 [Verruconis gallopava]KIW05887.1 hypothetical protein PV09_03082 [Verruconis gallopava]
MDAQGTSHPPSTGGGGTGGPGSGSTPATAPATSTAKLRKRTKTGCLTCRKRRIKCGEERPICQNCIKSKRTCEGYNQRLNWKTPIADWGGLADDGQILQFHNGMLASQPMGQYRPVPPPIDTAAFMPTRLPQGQPIAMGENGEPIFSPPNTGIPYMQNVPGLTVPSPYAQQFPSWTPPTPQYGHPAYGQSPISTHSIPPNLANPSLQSNLDATMQHSDLPAQQYRRPSQQIGDLPTPASTVQQDFASFFAGTPSQQSVNNAPLLRQGQVYWWGPNETASAAPPVNTQERAWAPATEPSSTAGSQGVGDLGSATSTTAPGPQAAKFLGHSLAGATAQFLEDAAIETYEDNYYDVESDEEMEDVPEKAFQQLSLMRKLHQDHLNELSARRYDTFLYSGMLDHYRAEEHANPLGNPKTARLFAHFIFATGPSLSIFERHPRNPSALFNETPSGHQQGIWTYTLPMKAIFNQGLLHAMLALSSLHISKLQGTSSMPSYKHYAYAIKRIHKNVGNANKKLLPTTIAATLLLGFYEVLTADHLKWSSHLAGAKQLLQSIPFKRMAKEARRYKAQQLFRKDEYAFYQSHDFLDRGAQSMSATIDESLVSILMGREVKVEQFGQVLDDDDDGVRGAKASPPFDPEKYELYQDLYWWYARQDVYQAILSGNKLLLDYHRWTDCPPRASMGRSDAIYGTHDHLILIFARIADFNARDRRRKIKVMDSNGGQWRPPPGMSMPSGPPPPAPQSNAPASRTPNTSFMQSASVTGQPSAPYPTMHMQNPPHYQSGASFGIGQGPIPATGHEQIPNHPFFGTLSGQVSPDLIQPNQMPAHQDPILLNTPQNFKHERGLEKGSAGSPFSSQAPMQSSSQAMGDPHRHSTGQRPAPPAPPSFYGMAPLPTTVKMPSSYAANTAHSTPSPKSEKSDYDLDAATESALAEWAQLKAALNTFESHLGPHFQPLPADLHPPTMTPFGPALFYKSHDVGIIWALYYMACIILQRCQPHMPPAALMAAEVAAQQTSQYATRIGQIVGGIVPPVMGPDLNPNLGACLCEAGLPLFFAGVQYRDPGQRAWLISLLRNVELRTGWKSIGMIAQGCEASWEKAAEAGRGPPYKRVLGRWHVPMGNQTTADHDHADVSGKIPRDHQGTRVHWAMGVLGVQEEDNERESRHVSGLQPSKMLFD